MRLQLFHLSYVGGLLITAVRSMRSDRGWNVLKKNVMRQNQKQKMEQTRKLFFLVAVAYFDHWCKTLNKGICWGVWMSLQQRLSDVEEVVRVRAPWDLLLLICQIQFTPVGPMLLQFNLLTPVAQKGLKYPIGLLFQRNSTFDINFKTMHSRYIV